jgi:hypothetical protein
LLLNIKKEYKMKLTNYNFQNYKSLSVLQFSAEIGEEFNFISASSAIKKDLLHVNEVDEGGSVNTITVKNKTGNYIFFADGDILSGAKQNRILNTSVLLEPNSVTDIPVSCVEQGRWHYRSRNFAPTDYYAHDKMRARKSKDVLFSLKMDMGHRADQRKIWDEVHYDLCQMDIKSETGNLSDAYESKRENFDDFLAHFRYSDNLNGAAFFINDKLLNVDIFGRKDIYKEYFDKFIRGAAFSAYNLTEKKEKMNDEKAVNILSKIMDDADKLPKEEFHGVGAGTESRFDNSKITGFELTYNSHLIHKAVLNIA